MDEKKVQIYRLVQLLRVYLEGVAGSSGANYKSDFVYSFNDVSRSSQCREVKESIAIESSIQAVANNYSSNESLPRSKDLSVSIHDIKKIYLDASESQEEPYGRTIGVIGSSQNYADNVVMSASRGHGFAAEKANHLYDSVLGKDAVLIGGDNAKYGADRLVDGVNIQTKYCSTGPKCISECFENGAFKYLNTDGSPMQIEVPADKYRSSVRAMESRIKRGQVPGVTDPEDAKKIVKQGQITYRQAKNIAQAGTVESLTYDSVNGIKLAATSMGISAAITFAVSLWNGEDYGPALKKACLVGLKVGGTAWVTSIVTAQLGRTGLEQALRGTTDYAVKQLGSKTASLLANTFRSGEPLKGAPANNHLSKKMRGAVITAAVTTLVMSSKDFVLLFQGRCSTAQVLKNVAKNASGVAGGSAAYAYAASKGALNGAAIGTGILPGVGSAVGAAVGTVVGTAVGLAASYAGSYAATTITGAVLDRFVEDDAVEMLRIIEEVFGKVAFDYMLKEEEAKEVIDIFKERDFPEFLLVMYTKRNKTGFVEDEFKVIIDKVLYYRCVAYLPDNEQLALSLEEALIDAEVA